LSQEKVPVFTALSVLTTITVECVMIVAPFLNTGGWAKAGTFALTGLALYIGVVINLLSALVAFERDEYKGGTIGIGGSGICLLTGVVILALQ
jgi:hypothetical protein